MQGGLSKEGEVRQVMQEKRGRLPGAFGPRRDLGPYSLQGLSRELTLLGPVRLPRGLGRSIILVGFAKGINKTVPVIIATQR